MFSRGSYNGDRGEVTPMFQTEWRTVLVVYTNEEGQWLPSECGFAKYPFSTRDPGIQVRDILKCDLYDVPIIVLDVIPVRFLSIDRKTYELRMDYNAAECLLLRELTFGCGDGKNVIHVRRAGKYDGPLYR